MNKLLAATLVSIGFVSAAPAVLAQAGDPAAAPGRPFAQRGHEQRAFSMPSERVEARLAYIKTALKITPAQESQWNAYAGVQRSHATAMDKRFQERRAQREKAQGERRRATAVERHERQRERMVTATQRLDALLAVEKPLYAALSPEQQRVADEVLAPRGRGGPGGPGRGHNRGGFGRG